MNREARDITRGGPTDAGGAQDEAPHPSRFDGLLPTTSFANRHGKITGPNLPAASLLFLLLLTVCGCGAASAADLHQRLFGADVRTWQRPPPLAIPAPASTKTPASPEAATQPAEGQRFIETLEAEERDVLLKERFYLLAGEDRDSPSRKRSGDAAVKGFVRALVIFDQPKNRVMELICATEKQASFLKDLDRSESLARQTDVGELTKFTIDIWFWHIDYWVQHWFYPECGRVEWFLDTEHFDNDIKGMAGFWQLYALSDKQSVAEYGIAVETGIPVPRSWKDAIQRRRIPGAMKQFIRYIDSNGEYRKKGKRPSGGPPY